jgi:sn-glycerol 3-phosphate transport system substrate-binding protein
VPTSDATRNLTFNGLAQIRHIAMMAAWHKGNYFSYFGRYDEADHHFFSGECAMLVSRSSLFPLFKTNKNLDFGVSALPYHDEAYGAPKNTLADGASIWVAAGLNASENRAVARFIAYLLEPEIQIRLTVAGGFLPMTPVARAAARSRLLEDEVLALNIAYSQLQGRRFEPPLRVSQIESVRTIIEEELESVWANKKSAKEALDDAVRRGNSALRLATPRR